MFDFDYCETCGELIGATASCCCQPSDPDEPGSDDFQAAEEELAF